MKIGFIGKFNKIYDEEYIARSFESLGHEVMRVEENVALGAVLLRFKEFEPDLVLFTKLEGIEDGQRFLKILKDRGVKTASWIFDLYFDYPREYRVDTAACFKAQYVVTTDGGHAKNWEKKGIKHLCVRQGIYKEECFMESKERKLDIVFVGSDNALCPERQQVIREIDKAYGDRFTWFGRKNTHEVRSTALNELYSRTKIVIGDSVYSPYYWSNRVVETLGRGGFLIHQEVPGLKEEFPHIVTYERGNINDLKAKIDYYLEHEEEREDIRKKNFEWVRDTYTMDKKCKELLLCLSK